VSLVVLRESSEFVELVLSEEVGISGKFSSRVFNLGEIDGVIVRFIVRNDSFNVFFQPSDNF